jgi:hypothetical protein
MRKYLAVLVAAAALAVPAAAAASPANDGAQCGTDAASGAFANVNGNFGFLGQRTPPGANGYQTGLNNSAVCGNR